MRRAVKKYGEECSSQLPEDEQWLDALVQYVTELGYLNDGALAKGLVNSYRRRGDSKRMMQQKLGKKGVPRDLVDQILSGEKDEAEVMAAKQYARKHKLGSFGGEKDYRSRQKDLQRMARRGFSYAVAQEALSEDSDARH